jgi:NAD(P)H-flavin reductase
MHPEDRLIWAPGQYLELSTADAPDIVIPYSIASAPRAAQPGEFELAVSANGGQDLLARVQPNVRLFVSTARGKFVWQPAPGATLLVGMGTGLAPLRAILQASLDREPGDRVTLLYGARSEADILWRDEFEPLAVRDSRFSFEPTLSQPGSGWRGRTGRVQEHLSAIVASLGQLSAYVCGSRAMVNDCVALLTGELGIEPARVRTEAH